MIRIQYELHLPADRLYKAGGYVEVYDDGQGMVRFIICRVQQGGYECKPISNAMVPRELLPTLLTHCKERHRDEVEA